MLSNKAQYALHALTFLAEQDPGITIPIQQIAEKRKIPYKFLENILLELKKNGILGSKSGKGGGYYLLKPPKDIKLIQIIRASDGPMALLSCVSKNFYEPCRICPYEENICPIRSTFLALRDATLDILESTSLNDLVNKSHVNKPSE